MTCITQRSSLAEASLLSPFFFFFLNLFTMANDSNKSRQELCSAKRECSRSWLLLLEKWQCLGHAEHTLSRLTDRQDRRPCTGGLYLLFSILSKLPSKSKAHWFKEQVARVTFRPMTSSFCAAVNKPAVLYSGTLGPVQVFLYGLWSRY